MERADTRITRSAVILPVVAVAFAGILFAKAQRAQEPTGAGAAIADTTGNASRGALLLFVYGLGKGVPLLLLGVASGSFSLMRSVSRITPALTRVGGAGLIVAAGYLVWVA